MASTTRITADDKISGLLSKQCLFQTYQGGFICCIYYWLFLLCYRGPFTHKCCVTLLLGLGCISSNANRARKGIFCLLIISEMYEMCHKLETTAGCCLPIHLQGTKTELSGHSVGLSWKSDMKLNIAVKSWKYPHLIYFTNIISICHRLIWFVFWLLFSTFDYDQQDPIK